MLAQIRAIFFKKALRELLAAQKRKRQTHTLESARNIGILFDASTETIRKEVAEFVKKVEKEGKKVRTIGFFNFKNLPEAHTFDAFTLKESSWAGVPNSEKATAFSKESFDLLLSFNPDETPQLEWLAAASPAAMKIGLATNHQNDFDIQLETPEGKGVHFFAEQLSIYLDKIVLTKS
jgi:hypothetical protein